MNVKRVTAASAVLLATAIAVVPLGGCVETYFGPQVEVAWRFFVDDIDADTCNVTIKLEASDGDIFYSIHSARIEISVPNGPEIQSKWQYSIVGNSIHIGPLPKIAGVHICGVDIRINYPRLLDGHSFCKDLDLRCSGELFGPCEIDAPHPPPPPQPPPPSHDDRIMQERAKVDGTYKVLHDDLGDGRVVFWMTIQNAHTLGDEEINNFDDRLSLAAYPGSGQVVIRAYDAGGTQVYFRAVPRSFPDVGGITVDTTDDSEFGHVVGISYFTVESTVVWEFPAGWGGTITKTATSAQVPR